METEEKTPSIGLVLGALATGVVLGMLFAPKKGSELRDDLGDMFRRNRDKARDLAESIGEKIPSRVKIAAGLGAAKGAAAEVLHEANDKVASVLRS